ncbi:GxGYxYP domain-containing protein [Carboxylicivirga marina]|uniref:Uncharacterized protein n=1 Tax=Carboxylicivirga marina TaxID=2800988 RepID=A0ABS1HNA1_9BACT|nr:GxGYxYP domain-containing protein [Carboxylicivirga marina]MBK3519162.1 hypothetical protein [Carboxylicivirga marina]
MKFYSVYLLCVVCLIFQSCQHSNTKHIESTDELEESWWWPMQPVPKGIVTCDKGTTHGENALVYSLSGLVAKAHKEGKVDELVWINSRGDYAKWYKRVVQRLNLQERGDFDVWKLLTRYKELGIVDGYILYSQEKEPKYNSDMNFSYNVAVSYAGLKKALVIEQSIEGKIKALGFTKLFDARNVTLDDCFHTLKKSLNNELVLTMNPFFHNNSDFAIANNSMSLYGVTDVANDVMSWLRPVSPVVGWNHGDEIDFTRLPSEYGLFNTASDWCDNLLTLSAGSKNAIPKKIKSLNPKDIDFNDTGHFHSFIMSDGDNMQWTIGRFLSDGNYWGSDLHGQFPVGFTSCPVNLSMMANDVLDEMVESKPLHTSIIEFGGGYQYPDLFAVKKGVEREELQRSFARKLNIHMKRTGAKIFGFICTDFDSQDAKDAYKIYAEELDDIIGMVVIQYAPYHGGHGDVIWVKNRMGIEIPVVSAKFSLWNGLNEPGGGDVHKITNCINKQVEESSKTLSWTSVHAWSRFENPKRTEEYGTGMKPIKWCIDNLDRKIKVISPEELLWRIRWNHNQDQTGKLIRDNY